MADELIGKIIGNYEVLSRIGEGGMATVYLARQQSMNRQVALKVLPQHFVKDDTYMERFKREVDIVSKLEHRNIVPVYDYGEYQGQPYIVMRYMGAGSLDDILRDGPLNNDKILSVISQIAPALDYAHSKGVLHRDLKPSNVLIDDDGGAFITDFGIARFTDDSNPSLTTQGVVGTPSYMSPEQAQGKPLDGRSDIYSLGVMLFEMATGRRPFESETPYSIAVMQVTAQPPMPRTLNPNISTALEVVILKALKKNREERYHNASVLMESLKMAIERPMAVHDTEPRLKMSSYEKSVEESKPQPLYVAPPNAASRPVMQPVSLRSKIRQGRQQNPLMSAFIGGSIGCGLLGIIIAAAFLALNFLLPASETPTPDAAETEAALETEAITGTDAPVNLSESPELDATSAAARATLLARSTNSANVTVTAAPLLTIRAVESPVVATIEGGTPQLSTGLRGVSGTIVFADTRGENNNYEIVTLNLDTWIETQLTQSPNANSSYPIPSPDGRWIAFQSNRDSEEDFDIFIVNQGGGNFQKMTFNDSWDRLAAWSPDGEWLLYSTETSSGIFELRHMRLDGSSDEVLYTNGGYNAHPRYSPDGRYLIFTSGTNRSTGNTWEVVRLEIGTNQLQPLTANNVKDGSPVFAPDGQTILYVTFNEETRSDALALMDINGENKRILFDSTGNEWAASFSPDGRYIIFTSDITGQDQLYLLNVENPAEAQQITTTGGAYATWIP